MLFLTWVVMGVTLGGCASGPPKDARDPMEEWNRRFYNFNESMDRQVMKPVSDFYKDHTPKPVRECFSNAFSNLGYFNVVLNDALQGNGKQCRSDALRMLVNSTVGIGGFLDVAKGWGMPKHDEDFGLTLGRWGEPQGEYLVLPMLGPTTTRDGWGLLVEVLTDPLTWLATPIGVDLGMQGAELVDERTRLSQEIEFRDRNAMDGYIFTREAYLQHRKFLVNGEKPTLPSEEELEGDLDDAAAGDGGAAKSKATGGAARDREKH